MPAPASATLTATAKEAMLTPLLALIDADTSAGYIEILDDSDVVLASITLTDPAGSIASGTLTLTMAGPDSSADASGTATYAVLYDGAGTTILSLPAVQSATPVANKIALNTTSVIAGGPVEIVSFTIG